MQIVYEYRGKLYINLTNRCANACDFCIRNHHDNLEGNVLWLEKEPSAQEVIGQIESRGEYPEYVFCGYGEPTDALEVLKEVAAYLKRSGKKSRLNTNGQANLAHDRDVTAELLDIDVFNVSLNQSSAEKYQAVCHSRFGLRAFDGLLEFSRRLIEQGKPVVLSVVDTIGSEDIEQCRRIATSLGATLRVRAYE